MTLGVTPALRASSAYDRPAKVRASRSRLAAFMLPTSEAISDCVLEGKASAYAGYRVRAFGIALRATITSSSLTRSRSMVEPKR